MGSFNRCLLAKHDLQNFKAFLDSVGIEHRAGKGDYQVLQVKTNRAGWQVVFDKHSNQHLTVNGKLEPMVRRFIASKKEPT
jgi:hypothetical protein